MMLICSVVQCCLSVSKDSFTIVMSFRFPAGRDANGEFLDRHGYRDSRCAKIQLVDFSVRLTNILHQRSYVGRTQLLGLTFVRVSQQASV